MSKRLEDILEEKLLQQERAEIDRPKILEEWKSAVSSLLETTRSWLSPLESKGYLELATEQIPIREEQLGDYEIDTLRVIFVTGRNLLFKPVGRFVLGAEGRVDIVSGGESLVMLMYKGRREWQFARRESRYSTPRTWAFTEGTLEELLAEFVEG